MATQNRHANVRQFPHSPRIQLTDAEIANDSDLGIRAPKNFLKKEVDETRVVETHVAPTEDPPADCRLGPGPRYRGKDIVVCVRDDGFEYAGQVYRSRSSAVRAATGTPWKSFAFFGLGSRPGRKRGSQE